MNISRPRSQPAKRPELLTPGEAVPRFRRYRSSLYRPSSHLLDSYNTHPLDFWASPSPSHTIQLAHGHSPTVITALTTCTTKAIPNTPALEDSPQMKADPDDFSRHLKIFPHTRSVHRCPPRQAVAFVHRPCRTLRSRSTPSPYKLNVLPDLPRCLYHRARVVRFELLGLPEP